MHAAGLPVHVTRHAKVDPQRQADRPRARTPVNPVNRLVARVGHPITTEDVLASHVSENRSRLSVERYVPVVLAPVPVSLQYCVAWATPNPVLMPVPVSRACEGQMIIIIILVHVDAQANLAHVTEALGGTPTLLGAGQGRQQ